MASCFEVTNAGTTKNCHLLWVQHGRQCCDESSTKELDYIILYIVCFYSNSTLQPMVDLRLESLFCLFDLFAPNHKLNEPFFFFFASVYKSARDSQHKKLYIHAKLKWLPTWHKSCAKLGDGDFNLVARSWDTPTGINFVSDGCADMLAFGWA